MIGFWFLIDFWSLCRYTSEEISLSLLASSLASLQTMYNGITTYIIISLVENRFEDDNLRQCYICIVFLSAIHTGYIARLTDVGHTQKQKSKT